jgi:2'-5' RNA ligase
MKKEYGCLMLKCYFKDWDKCLSLIPDDIVFDDETHSYGKETEPHITILFGFHKEKDNVEKIKKYLLDNIKDPIKYTITGISTFDNPKFTVLKLDVESKELTELNDYFKNNFDHTNEHKIYHPHITLAYIKKEFTNNIPKNFKIKKTITLESKGFKYSA